MGYFIRSNKRFK